MLFHSQLKMTENDILFHSSWKPLNKLPRMTSAAAITQSLSLVHWLDSTSLLDYGRHRPTDLPSNSWALLLFEKIWGRALAIYGSVCFLCGGFWGLSADWRDLQGLLSNVGQVQQQRRDWSEFDNRGVCVCFWPITGLGTEGVFEPPLLYGKYILPGKKKAKSKRLIKLSFVLLSVILTPQWKNLPATV